MKLMILGASILQMPAIKKAKEMGIRTIVCDFDNNAVGKKEADCFYCVSTLDEDALYKIALTESVDGIMTLASDRPMPVLAKIAGKLGLPSISYECAIKATNKAKMRECLKNNHVAIPYFFAVNNEKSFFDSIKKISTPFIVKPSDNSGSRGIYLVENLSMAKYAYRYSLSNSISGTVLIEEYLDGPEVSVESITLDGKTEIIAITDKMTTGAPHFVELGHSIQSQLSDEIKREIIEVTCRTIEAVGIKNGPSHTELKITSNGVKVVEIGARLGGDNITTTLVPLATGINMVEICIKLALNMPVNIPEKKDHAAAIRYIKSNEGEIREISGVNNASKIEGIQQVHLDVKMGDKIGEVESSNSRLGFVIAQGKCVQEAILRCNQALECIKIGVI